MPNRGSSAPEDVCRGVNSTKCLAVILLSLAACGTDRIQRSEEECATRDHTACRGADVVWVNACGVQELVSVQQCLGCDGRPSASACTNGECVRPCCPDCRGRECGSDGCGGTCGGCVGTETCGRAGQCLGSGCTDACVAGEKRCTSGGVSTCATAANGCTEWRAAQPCPTPTACGANGACVATCSDACVAGAKKCVGNGVSTCRGSASGCLEWSAPVACAANTACDASAMCVPVCTDVCALNANQCANGASQRCERNGQGCLAWSAATACDAGVCSSATACATCPATGLMRNGHCWEFVAEPIVTAKTARLHAMAMDADGGVHVVFYDEVAATENYIRRTAAGWGPRQALAPVSTGVCFGDIAIDRLGFPVAVFDAPNPGSYGIRYARIDPVTSGATLGWVRNASSMDSLATPRLSFDTGNTMHVVYSDGYDHDSLYARGTLSGSTYSFTYFPVWTTGEAEYWNHIAVGPSGIPSVLYTTTTTTGLTSRHWLSLATWNGSGFSSQALSNASQDVTFQELSLQVDAQGAQHLVYFERASSQLRYAVQRNGGWTTTVLSTTIPSGNETALVLDAQGAPHFAVSDGYWYAPKYLWLENGTVRSIVPTTQCVGRDQLDIAVDSQGLPHFTCPNPVNGSGLDTLMYVAPRRLW